MVDEYVYVIKLRGEAEKRSDSSMVDEYEYPARPSTGRTGSDSSMVDEYYLASLKVISASKVQIPLWSMNTQLRLFEEQFEERSDSSMVDEYLIWLNN